MSKHRTHRTTWWDRLLSGVLCLALALGLVPAAGLVRTAEAAHWAEPFAERLVDWGVMTPSLATKLDSRITRAEFVAMCNRAFGYTRLGNMPFVDVPSSSPYAEDINIAYNAGYFSGTSTDPSRPKASPDDPLTREQAAVLVGKNMMLQRVVGESLSFTDSRDISDWSRGMVEAAVAEGVLSGYPDGSFRPQSNITRGEIAAILVKIIGTPLNQKGSYELGDVYGNVVINSSRVTLRDTVILGNLYVTGGVDLGNVLLENVTVLGRIVVGGGGESDAAQSSVILRNVKADELVIDSMVDHFVTVSAYGLTDIPVTYVRSDAYLEDSCSEGYGLQYIEFDADPGTKLQLAGDIKEVRNLTPFSDLQLVRGTARKITVDEYARGSTLLVDINTRVDELNLDVATLVTGRGDIIDLNIGADGCEVDILPEHVWIRAGITATVNGELIGSTEASALSSEPRLLAGYPKADSLRPTQAEGLYAGNKPGTIYWAVSAVSDGSVTVENLVKNPVYGGNILKDGDQYQSGSIDAGTGTDYGRLISGLMPGGSYYISAILEDARGIRSPLKVVSFSAPDDTKPAFMDGFPRMSKVSCDIAQVTAMANKTCLLYWVLLPHGAAAPTVQNFKTSTFGGNYGYGSINVVKNVQVSVQVNFSRLQEKTGYDLYLWLNDLDGTQSSDVVKVLDEETQRPADPSFTTPDETPPVVISIMQNNPILADSARFSFAINEAPSKLYWAVVTADDDRFITESMTDQYKQLKVEFGNGAIASGSSDAAGARVETQASVTGLDYEDTQTHTFKLYYMAEDADKNRSEVRSIIIYTLDNEEPTVTLRFDPAKYGSQEDLDAGRKPQPLTNSDIILIFSEQVKGDEDDAKTFVELYNSVKQYKDLNFTETESDKNSVNPTNELTKAKNALGKELEKHIALYYLQNSTDRPGSSRPGTALKPKGVNAGDSDFGWLNLREAVVEQVDGEVWITLGAGEAVQLGGGLSYYFQFENIVDDAYYPNPLKLTREDGSVDGGKNAGRVDPICYTDTFTTVYAQVWLEFVGDDVFKVGTEDVRMDILMDVRPDSISSTASNAYWDMIMWSDTTVNFEIYRKNGDTWAKLSDEIIYGASTPGVSLNSALGYANPQRVAGTLEEGKTYSYGIHFTSVKGVAETDRATAHPAWGDKVTMWFSMIAGPSTQVKAVSGGLRTNFDEDRNLIVDSNSSVSEIGADAARESESKLMAWHQFTNTEPPEFYSSYPQFDEKSNSVTMWVMMQSNNTTGKLYWLAAPMNSKGEPTLPTVTGALTEIDSTNDRDNKNADEKHKTYIPTDGGDRNTNEEYIYYKSGGNKTKSEPGIDMVIDPTSYLGDPESSGYVWSDKPEEVSRALKPIEIKGLEPNTKYYIYIVLEGKGDNSTSVTPEIYQVTTQPAYPPVITIDATGMTAGIETFDGAPISSDANRPLIDSDLNWALVNLSKLPDFFQYKFSWATYKDVTLLDMLTRRTGSTNKSKTLFDEYAGVATRTATADDSRTKASEYKDDIMSFIRDEGAEALYDIEESPVDHNSASFSTSAGDPYSPVFRNVPKDNYEVKYGLLVFARVAGAGDGTENYSFAATQGLYLPDPIPPAFVPQTRVQADGVTSYVRVTDIKGYNSSGTENKNWRNLVTNDAEGNPPANPAAIINYTFEGDFTITFSKPLYQLTTSGVLREVVVSGATSGTKVNLKDVISKPSGVTLTVSEGESTGEEVVFEIHFKGLQYGQSLTILNSGRITNSSPAAEVSNKQLKLLFNPLITAGTFGDTWLPDMITGGFVATWEDVLNS